MISRLLKWLDQKTLKEQLQYAGAQYSLASAAMDEKRMRRLKIIIEDLEQKLKNT